MVVMELNINNDVDKKRKTYNAENQAKYRKKVKQYNVKYSLSDNDLQMVEKLEKAIVNSGMSSNAFIKMVLKKYIDEM